MESIEILKEEHEDIATFLAILEKIINALATEKRAEISSEDLEWLFEFNRDFILKSHHGKEERLLFPAMIDLGIPEEAVNILVSEHELMRYVAKTIRGLIESFKDGDLEAAFELVEIGRSYIQLLKDHIENEESVLYPIVNELIPKERDTRLAYKLRLFSAEQLGAGRLIELHELLDNLKVLYGVSKE